MTPTVSDVGAPSSAGGWHAEWQPREQWDDKNWPNRARPWESGVNIASMSLSRDDRGGRALTVLNLDTRPEPAVTPVPVYVDVFESGYSHDSGYGHGI